MVVIKMKVASGWVKNNQVKHFKCFAAYNRSAFKKGLCPKDHRLLF